MEKNYAVIGLLGGEDFFVNVFANSEQEAIEKAVENVQRHAPDEEFDIFQVEVIEVDTTGVWSFSPPTSSTA